jgi:uncharacterized protein YicC (UPF0701 family)|tara:strand:+ start:2896 stop:3270 length:375 start_codon:yes stop_codon:yes gene_type:complete
MAKDRTRVTLDVTKEQLDRLYDVVGHKGSVQSFLKFLLARELDREISTLCQSDNPHEGVDLELEQLRKQVIELRAETRALREALLEKGLLDALAHRTANIVFSELAGAIGLQEQEQIPSEAASA